MPYDSDGYWWDDEPIVYYTYVNAGQTVTGAILTDLHSQFVNGGTASGSLIQAGGLQTVSNGGRSVNAKIFAGGAETIGSGGTGVKTAISGGVQSVLGGSVDSATIVSGGVQTLSNGGYAFRTSVKAGGTQNVKKGGIASSALVAGTQNVFGGTAWAGPVSKGGRQIISGGGLSVSAGVKEGGFQTVKKGGTASAFILSAGAGQKVEGGAAKGGQIRAGASQEVTGGSASGVKISAGAYAIIRDAGVDRNATIAGAQALVNGGQAFGGTIVNGGGQTLQGVGVNAEPIHVYASGMRVSNGGWQTLLGAGASASATTLFEGGNAIATSSASMCGAVLSGGVVMLQEGAQSVNAKVLAGGSIMNYGARASNTFVASGGSLVLQENAGAWGGSIAGSMRVFAGCSASGVAVVAGGIADVSPGAKFMKGTVSSGGNLLLDGDAEDLVLKAGASLEAKSVRLAGSNRIDAVKQASGVLTLSKGASMTISGKASAGGLIFGVDSGSLYVSGAGAKLAGMSISKGAVVSFDIGKLKAGTITALTLAGKNSQKVGSFSISATAQQQMGSYGITQNLVQAKNTAWAIYVGSNAVGSALLNGTGFSKNGVTYSMTAAKDKITLTIGCKAGNMLKGTASGGDVRATANSDIFANGTGSETFRNGNGRDCAVYGKEKWGQDAITKTSGTLALIFKDLKAADVTSSLSGSVMTFAKKADAKQTIAVSGWDSVRYSVVFGGAMSAFDAWAKAASPTTAQTSAARTEVWKKAGLATA